MPLKPLHQWKLDKDGRPELDEFGRRIPHPKAGTPKKLSEYTDEEKKDFQIRKEASEAMNTRIARYRQRKRDEDAKALGL